MKDPSNRPPRQAPTLRNQFPRLRTSWLVGKACVKPLADLSQLSRKLLRGTGACGAWRHRQGLSGAEARGEFENDSIRTMHYRAQVPGT